MQFIITKDKYSRFLGFNCFLSKIKDSNFYKGSFIYVKKQKINVF